MSPKLSSPVPFIGPFTTADLGAAGVTPAALRGWRERKEVEEIARGVFVTSGAQLDELSAIWSSRLVATGRTPVSSIGAAAIHGLWTPPRPDRSNLSHDRRRVVPSEHLTRRGKLLVPTLEWTAVQLTRGQHLEGALIAIDSALRCGAAVESLREVAELCSCWPGVSAVFTALEHGDGQSESALESWSRGLMIRHGIPVPELQHKLRVGQRNYFADFFWPSARVIGEADGMAKYVSADIVANEKRRQGQIQGAGYTVYRWGWPEVVGDARRWLYGLRRALGS